MSDSLATEHEWLLRGHPGVPSGLVAFGQLIMKPDGEPKRHRGGAPRFGLVRVRAEHVPASPSRSESDLRETDWRWCTRSIHSWKSIVDRFGADATAVVEALARDGCVAIEHTYRAGVIEQPPRRTIPHPGLVAADQGARAQRAQRADDIATRAGRLAGKLDESWPGVASALRSSQGGDRLLWTVRAADDLAAGLTYNGPRAFVSEHAGDTKAREDIGRMLLDAGWEPAALDALGISRNPYIGLSGPLSVTCRGRTLDLTGWPGPVDLRAPGTDPLTVAAAPGVRALVVIENRQAAETVGDDHPDVALVWSHGQPPEPVLELIAALADAVPAVLLCPDADLGGVRIAARMHDRLARPDSCVVVDVGQGRTGGGAPFGPAARAEIEVFAERQDAVGRLAKGCLDRGVAVEQEAPIRDAVGRALREC